MRILVRTRQVSSSSIIRHSGRPLGRSEVRDNSEFRKFAVEASTVHKWLHFQGSMDSWLIQQSRLEGAAAVLGFACSSFCPTFAFHGREASWMSAEEPASYRAWVSLR